MPPIRPALQHRLRDHRAAIPRTGGDRCRARGSLCAVVSACCWRLQRRDGRNPGRARQLSRQHHHGLRQLPHAARRRRQADRRQGALRRADASTRRPSSPPRRTSRPMSKPGSEAGAMPRSSARWSRACGPSHGHLAGVPLAAIMPANFYKALLPDDLDAVVAYLRTVKPVRNEVADPVYKAPVHRDPYPDAEAGFDKAMFADPGQARRLSRHHRPLHGMPLGMVARRLGFQDRPGPRRPGFSRSRGRRRERRQHRRQYHLGSDRRHRRLERSGNRPRHHPWRRPRRTSAQAADGLSAIMPG